MNDANPDESPFAVQDDVRGPWRDFLDRLEPLRPDLYRYCLGLTRSIWDAEDLTQDVLLKVFGVLGKLDRDLENPRAYLLRTATHLWIDQLRRLERYTDLLHAQQNESTSSTPAVAESQTITNAESRSAATFLLTSLAPQERAAVLLKDVFDYSLEEIASTLKTTTGAVKSALHRGRKRTGQEPKPSTGVSSDSASPEVVEKFMLALSQRDIDGLKALCLDDVAIELVGGATSESFEEGKSFFEHAHFVMPEIGFGEDPNWRTATYRGETLVLGFRTLDGVEGLNEIHRLQTTHADGAERILRVRCYCFAPDVLRALGEELHLPALNRPYRSPS